MCNPKNPFGKVIHSYSRMQAIEDGCLVDVSTPYPDDTRIYKYPVAVTAEVWALIAGRNTGAWLWDICWMSTRYVIARPDESSVIFLATLPIKTGSFAGKSYRLKAVIGPGDNAEPVITIMFANQD